MARFQRYPGQFSLERMLRRSKAERMTRESEAMTRAEVNAAIHRIIAERFARDGEEAMIAMDDFKRANLPMDLVDPVMVCRLIRAARDDMARERT